MKITVDSSRMARACSLANKNVPSKSTIAIVSNLHIVADEGTLHISSTDMETWVVYDVPATICFDGEANAFCINAANITNLLMSIPSQPISIEVKKHNAVIKHSNGSCDLPIASANDFPILRPIEGEDHMISAELLRQSIQTCSFALYNDAEAKPSIASLLLDFNGSSMVAVGTDGNRIARLEHPDIEGEKNLFMLPKKTLALLKVALDEVIKDKDAMDVVLLRMDNNNVRVQMASYTLYFRQTEQRFPKYDSVIPNKDIMPLQAVMNRMDLLSAITRASLFTNPGAMKLKFIFDGTKDYVLVSGENVDFSTSSEERVNCEFTESHTLTIALKATFLKEALTHMASEQVRFYMIDHTRQVVIREENGNPNLLMLLMPMLLNY